MRGVCFSVVNFLYKMKKINFKKVKVYTDVQHSNFQEVDIRESLANIIYKTSEGIAGLECARKIYNSKDNEEYSDRDMQIIRSVINKCTPQFFDALNTVLNDQE